MFAVCLAKGVLFVAMIVCPRRVAIAGHVIKLKLTRRGNVNGKAAFSSLQTIWWRWRLVGVQVHCSAERSTSSR